MRAPTWVYDAWAVSRPVLYTEPTAAQIPPNFPFRASAQSPGRLLDGDALGQILGLSRCPRPAAGRRRHDRSCNGTLRGRRGRSRAPAWGPIWPRRPARRGPRSAQPLTRLGRLLRACSSRRWFWRIVGGFTASTAFRSPPYPVSPTPQARSRIRSSTVGGRFARPYHPSEVLNFLERKTGFEPATLTLAIRSLGVL